MVEISDTSKPNSIHRAGAEQAASPKKPDKKPDTMDHNSSGTTMVGACPGCMDHNSSGSY